jgi:hypothetical protein
MNIDPEIAAMDAEMTEAMENPKSVTVYRYNFDTIPMAQSDYETEPTVIDFKFPETNPKKRKIEETKQVLYPRKKPRLTREVRDLLLNSINNQPRLIPYNVGLWEIKYGPNAVLSLNKGHC